MGFFDYIATFLNSLLALIQKGANFQLPTISAPTIGSSPENGYDPVGDYLTGKNVPNTQTPAQEGSKAVPAVQGAPGRASITKPERISARFNDTGSPAWAAQPGGKHLGTDFSAPDGSAVYAPYDMTIIKLGHYDDTGKFGDYVMGHLADGTEYYSGHLKNVLVKNGTFVKAGTQIGQTNLLNHTHVQLRVNGNLYDFEKYAKAHP